MGTWRAKALDSVRQDVIARELEDMGLDWAHCAHVPATSSLARAIRQTKTASMPIATLIDLVVMDALPGGRNVDISEFPSHAAFENEAEKIYMAAVTNWQNRIAGRRIWMSIEYQQHLRDFLERRGLAKGLQRVITRSLRDFIKTSQSLIAAGVRPELLKPTEQVAKAATDAWMDLEKNYPAVRAVRDDLWMDLEEFEAGATDKAKSLRSRIYRALEQVFGKTDGVRTIVYHGYYFFTPPQWAFFQLLRKLPDVNQLFIVHDDGQSPIFETWRWYFVQNWKMPDLEAGARHGAGSPAFSAFHSALQGERVDAASLDGRLQVIECRNATQFVRHWAAENSNERAAGRKDPKLYAASAGDISRYLDRFAGVSQVGKVNLSLLPLGSYLLALHDCITLDSSGSVRIEVEGHRLIDIASSGYLPEPVSLDIAALSRAMPFFADCRLAADWVERANVLRGLVGGAAGSLGARTPLHNDVERLKSASDNPVRLAPWADLSVDDVDMVVSVIQNTVAIATEIASTERVSLKQHIKFIKGILLRGMRNLPVEVKQEIEQKVSGMSVAIDAEVSADGLKDVVSLLLGQTADFTLTGTDIESDMVAGELRALDALGLTPLDCSIHIANLADSTFPSRGVAVGWPYRFKDIEIAGAAIDEIAIEILRTRSKTASLSDLYLLSLGLNGISGDNKITLSYIAEVGSEVNNPSPVLTLLTIPGHRPTKAIIERAGGLTVKLADMVLDDTTLRTRRSPAESIPSAADLEASAASVAPTAAASAIACPRRFALQWATGPSAAYMSDHHHLMLYGNLRGSLPRLGFDTALADETCRDLWQQFTEGQRTSSEFKAVVKQAGGGVGPPWLFTLSGSKYKNDAISRAYQAAVSGLAQPDSILAPQKSSFLPAAPEPEKFDVCNVCPVRSRCAVWFKPAP